MSRLTVFSECRTYRYTLWRKLDNDLYSKPAGVCNFLMLNPSTADESQDDPTVRRCIGFAQAWGYAELVVTNIFAFRATDPRTMLAREDPVGPDNDRWILETAKEASIVVAAWGTHGSHRGRSTAVRNMLKMIDVPLMRLKKIAGDQPSHPLYLPGTLLPSLWS